jgi:hypothetical protein
MAGASGSGAGAGPGGAGGAAGAGGSSGAPGGSGGVGGSAAGGGGTGGASSAVLKFCNNLLRNNQSVSLTLEVGASNPTIVSASSGMCTPVVSAPCHSIPTGSDVPATLRYGAQILEQVALITVADGDEWLLVAALGTTGPTLEGGPLLPEYVCSELDPTATSAAFAASARDENAGPWSSVR